MTCTNTATGRKAAVELMCKASGTHSKQATQRYTVTYKTSTVGLNQPLVWLTHTYMDSNRTTRTKS